ncbi:unnamed protein product, partial [Rotaria sordida]
HNIWKTPDQDPAAWSPSATAIMASALHIRYTLLPYYYTLFYKAHTQGSTVIRPLFHEYPTDKNTLDIFLQFLVGQNIMLAPVTDDGARQVQPKSTTNEQCQFNADKLYKALDGINKFIESSQINDNEQKQLTKSVEISINAVNQLINEIEALK